MELVSANVVKQTTTAGIGQDMLTRALTGQSLAERREVVYAGEEHNSISVCVAA